MNKFLQHKVSLFTMALLMYSCQFFAQTKMDTIIGQGFKLIVPQNITVECSTIPQKTNPIVITECANQNTSFLFDEYLLEEDCSNNFTIYRIWDVYTPCQEHFEIYQEVSVQDTKPPTIADMPSDITVQCNQVPPLPQLKASDNCSALPNLTVTESIQQVNTTAYNFLRVWTTSDPCGNTKSSTQKIAVMDTEKPKFTTALKDIVVDCANIPIALKPSYSDNCDSAPTVTFKETKYAGTCTENYTIKRSWTVKDKSGNASTLIQNVTVVDKTAPTFTIPPHTNVSCDAIPKVLLPAALNIKDNCATNVTVKFTEEKKSISCSNTYRLWRTYSVTDKCNNRLSKSQVISVSDKKAPQVTNFPDDVTVTCTTIPAADFPTVTDECSKTIKLSLTEQVIPGTCSDNYLIKRTFSYSDECSNITKKIRNITVSDTEKPVFANIPTDLSITASSGQINNISLNASDNCDKTVTISFSEALVSNQPTSGNSQCTKHVTRTWLATDNCNNSNSATQNIYLTDDVAPVIINAPTDITLNCGQALPPAPTNIIAIDTMGLFQDNIPVTFYEKTTAGSCNGFSNVERFWTAVDFCNNAKTVSQKITYNIGSQNLGLVAHGGDNTGKIDENLLQNATILVPKENQNYKTFKNLDSDLIKTVEVFSFEGRQIFVTDSFGRAIVQLNQYEKGIYIIRISDGKNVEIKKIFRQ